MLRVLSMGAWTGSVVFVAAELWRLLFLPMTGGAEWFIRLAILLLFALGLGEIARMARRVRAEHVSHGVFSDLWQQVRTGQRKPTPYSLRDPMALRRLNHMVECTRPERDGEPDDLSKLHDAVPAAAALDATIMANRYTPLSVYAWVLPVLGFMGTALGMADAIGAFKGAISSSANDVQALVNTLGDKVIPGLASAFHLTILALGASLVVYLCSSTLRDWEQEALNKLDRDSIVILSRVPLPERPEGKRIAAAVERLRLEIEEALSAPSEVKQAADVLTRAGARLTVSAEEFRQAAADFRADLAEPIVVAMHRKPRSASAPPPVPDGNARAPGASL